MNRIFTFAIVAVALAFTAPAGAIEFQEGTEMELYRFSKGGSRATRETVCSYSYLGTDVTGHRFQTDAVCLSPIRTIWLNRETGEYVRWTNTKRGPASKNLEREGDALFLSGRPGEAWKVSFTDKWSGGSGRSRKGRFKGKCQADEAEGGYYTVKCRGGVVGDGMTVYYNFIVSADTGLWQKVVVRTSRGGRIVWDMRRQPQTMQP